MTRPINPLTNQPHDMFKVEGTAYHKSNLPDYLTAIVAGECPQKYAKGGIRFPLRFPLLIASGLATKEKECLEKIVKILNEHWYDESEGA